MAETTKLKLTTHTRKASRKTVRVVIDDYLQNVIDTRKNSNAMLDDASVVKILLGEKVTEELRREQKQAGEPPTAKASWLLG